MAEHLELTPIEYEGLETTKLATTILDERRGERVLVVGHSNTVGDIIKALGGEHAPRIADDTYDDLFAVFRFA